MFNLGLSAETSKPPTKPTNKFPNDPHSKHHSLITLVHSKTVALAKLIAKAPRRHKDILGVLDEANDALEEFAGVEWPPKVEGILSMPSWMDGSESEGASEQAGSHAWEQAGKLVASQSASQPASVHSSQPVSEQSSVEGDNEQQEIADAVVNALGKELQEVNIHDESEVQQLHEEVLMAGSIEKEEAVDETEEAADEIMDAIENDIKAKNQSSDAQTESTDSKPTEEEEKQPQPTQDFEQQKALVISKFESIVKKKEEPQAASSNESRLSNVDAAAMEPMHPAVITTLHGLCMIISSESRTVKMCEIALECITLLTNGRYVSGVAGGRMKLEQQKKIHELIKPDSNGLPPPAVPTVTPASGHDGRDGGLSFLGYVVESITRASESPSEVVQGGMCKALLSIMTCPKCGVHEAAMLQAVRSTFHVYLVGKTGAGKEVARRTLVDMLKSVFNRMEAYDVMNREKKGEATVGVGEDDGTETTVDTATTNGTSTKMGAPLSPTPGTDTTAMFASQYHTDSYLLFRALCKLSSKTLPGDENVGMTNTAFNSSSNFFSTQTPVDPLALNSKILSLELILAVFEHCGDAFRNGEKFIYAVQSYLCVSLLKNCMSNQTSVAHLSLKIFLLLVKKFKGHLKAEIEVFVANIFLRVLESPNSPFEQKFLVLEALRALCADPQMLTQLFLNYDCDFDAVNLYKDIVHHVTRISAKACAPSNPATATKRDIDQEMDLSRTGLEVLVVILRSFLKALDLPGGDDVFDESDGSSSLSLLRQNLKLDITNDPAFDEKLNTSRRDTAIAIDDSDHESNKKSKPQLNRFGSTGFAEKIVDAFDKKRTAEQNFEIGMVKFTLSLKSGLLFFIDSGFVQLDARDMARFLYENKERLDKTQTGEVLGKEPDAAFVKDNDATAEKGGKGFFLRVLYHYVDLMNFEGLMFDDAIRLFLSGFRLPGEAQKIDRIMEKFAERFTRQNTDVFPSADTAFILAFSVIMLNTDLHNPSIKPERRMTLESFIRNNRGISIDGGDLPEEFLSGIFNRIKERPFSLKEDDEARKKAATKESTTFDSLFVFEGPFGSTSEEKKREKFRKEREEMMAASEQLFKKRPPKQNPKKQSQDASIDSVSPRDVVKPMFDVTWGPLIGTLSQVLESSTNETSIALCLSGFVYSIRISSHSGMSLARNTFVNSLAKFTTLGSIKEMKSKNIECIRTLLSIAIIDGEYLGESWSPILQCISQLGRLHLFASGLDSEDQFLQPGSAQLAKLSDAAREMEENNGKAVLAAVNEILIDKVFSSTVTLSARGIVSFIDQLIAVSDAEILGDTKKGISGVSSSPSIGTKTNVIGKVTSSGHGNEGPRIFSLQRLVEVADYNMNIRPRLTWSQIWENMGSHFAKVGCHENSMVSMFAIDALRQLSFKFLEKPELSDFNFQRLFLKPFLVIMENPESREDTRELVLRCVDNIIRSLAHNLRSGWKIFFSILMSSSSDPSAKINTLGLAILQRLLDEHLNELCRLANTPESAENGEQEELSSLERRQRNTNAEDFVGLCRASLSFVQTEESENPLPIGLSMRALCHTACYADLIADKRVLPPVSGCQCTDPVSTGFTYEGLSEEESLEMAIWRPLLDGLASGMCSSASSISGGVGCLVQRGSLMALRAILLRHGKLFSVSQWSAILNYVILPAIQIGAENDSSPVLQILSDSPSVSSLDFLGEPLPLPPSCDNEGLKKFAEMAQSEESSPKRTLGNAELLVETSFADLRHGGDGDLSKAYLLKKKDIEKRMDLQPFPDSWIATTAPIALGMMSDLLSEHFLDLGAEGREVLWPLLMGQLLRWSIGAPQDNVEIDKVTDDIGNEIQVDMEEWQPCEALVRIGCKEWGICFLRIVDAIPRLSKEESRDWLSTFSTHLSEALVINLEAEKAFIEDIVQAKFNAIKNKDGVDQSPTSKKDISYLDLLPRLKIRCIASHCLQQYLSAVSDKIATFTRQAEVSRVLDALILSRLLSCDARQNGDLAHAFQEASFEQWGVSVEQVDAALLRSNSGALHRGSCPMFFLTQEASASKAEVRLLSSLYCHEAEDVINEDSWDSVSFAEPLLMERIQEVLNAFISSDEKDGPSIDPNIWRNANESGCQVAYYCTSYVGVAINILETISMLDSEKFGRHRRSLFPLLCTLVRAQSAEIRHLVSNIFRCQVGPLIDVSGH